MVHLVLPLRASPTTSDKGYRRISILGEKLDEGEYSIPTKTCPVPRYGIGIQNTIGKKDIRVEKETLNPKLLTLNCKL
jgi:hypothetical protein